MTKRYADSTHGVKVKVKKRKGVKVRTVNVLDSDAEDPPDVDAEYARLLKTRVATSGKADSVTMNSLQLFEVKYIPHNDTEPTIDSYEEVAVENTVPRATTKKPRKKKNDSVRFALSTNGSSMLTVPQTKMQTWLDVRSTVLDEIVTLNGPGSNRLDCCNSCENSQATPLYRCLECSYSLLYCSGCILKSHTMSPLHRLEVYSYF